MRRGAALAALVTVAGGSAPAWAEEPSEERYHPFLSYRLGDIEMSMPVMVAGRVEGVSSFPVDRDGNTFQSGAAISPLVRLGARIESVKPLGGKFLVFAEYEHDLLTGTWTSREPLAGADLPNSTALASQIRKGWARFSVGPYFHVGGGLMTSHWGLGLLANDGAHGWEPGSARFTDPRSGNLVLRGFVGMGPLGSSHVAATLAIDKVRSDNVLLAGDSAYQAIASVVVGHDRPNNIGYFLVHRRQEAADGSVLEINVVDMAGRLAFDLPKQAKLTLEAEGALIFGYTTLGASVEHPDSSVTQLGGVLRASLAYPRVGGVLDLVYASGDSNTHDGRVMGFHANPNFETGLLLFRYVQAAQTGRGYATATDPALVGFPPGGAERLPSRGGLSNAVVVFPRVWARPVRGLETYGGVLVALAPTKNVDAFNTDIAGGSPRNALGGSPGAYWGTEIDLGARYRLNLRGMQLDAGVEGGVLFPGSALADAAGKAPGPVYGGRFMLGYRL
ncbi:MAG: hypothetical protein QM820_05540 [Minicystis sp.]